MSRSRRRRRVGAWAAGVLAAALASGPARAEEGQGEPFVHVTFPAGGHVPLLEERVGVTWSSLCMAPCDRGVAPLGAYRIVGLDGVPSETFRLPPGARRVVVDARVGGGQGVRAAGTIFVVAGLAVGAIGGVVLFAPEPKGDGAHPSTAAKTVVGVGAMVLGAAFAALGAAVIVLADTSVHVHAADADAPR